MTSKDFWELGGEEDRTDEEGKVRGAAGDKGKENEAKKKISILSKRSWLRLLASEKLLLALLQSRCDREFMAWDAVTQRDKTSLSLSQLGEIIMPENFKNLENADFLVVFTTDEGTPAFSVSPGLDF